MAEEIKKTRVELIESWLHDIGAPVIPKDELEKLNAGPSGEILFYLSQHMIGRQKALAVRNAIAK